jgi:hypothetical protein
MVAALLLVACVQQPLPTASPSATPEATAIPTASPTPSPEPTASSAPTPTPAPSLSLEPPEARDDRVVAVDVSTEVAAGEGGTILVTVTSAADTRIDELVLRWPTDVDEALFLAPFTPSDERIREGGPPLVQDWTKWVIGPGERGEPAGTTSLGWGPLLAGATLQIPIVVNRRADGPIAFDLQILAGNDQLSFDDGGPAQLRVEVP